MPDYTVTHVRMERSGQGGSHEHIAGVCAPSGTYYPRLYVDESLDAGSDWQTVAYGVYATIRKIRFCKHVGCLLTPYITTDADSSAANNLDNLPRC